MKHHDTLEIAVDIRGRDQIVLRNGNDAEHNRGTVRADMPGEL